MSNAPTAVKEQSRRWVSQWTKDKLLPPGSYHYRHHRHPRDTEFKEWWAKVCRQFPTGFRQRIEITCWEAWCEATEAANLLRGEG